MAKLADVPAHGPERRAMVLLVDDDESVRRLLARGLRGAGYDVLEAADGQLALRILKRERDVIDLVITDIRMPRFDGYQLAEWMAVWDCPQPLVFITGQGAPDRSIPGPVLYKPVSLEDLVVQVRRSLRQVGIRPANPRRGGWSEGRRSHSGERGDCGHAVAVLRNAAVRLRSGLL